MSKNTSQIALITHRRGLKSELPKQLNEGEFALTTDTNEIFMGNPNNPVLQERLKGDEPKFPYGNIQVLTEFSDNMDRITYSYKNQLNPVTFPIVVKGTQYEPTLPKGSTLIINEKEIQFGSNVTQINDYDYLVLRYLWSDGRDLDTDTKIVNADNIPSINNKSLGWNLYDSVPTGSRIEDSILYWGGDNTSTGSEQRKVEENVLISRKNLEKEIYTDLLPEILKLELRAMWYSEVGNNPVQLEILAYKDGVMRLDVNNKRFINEGGTQIKFKDSQGNERDSLKLEVLNMSNTTQVYQLIGNVYYNTQTRETFLTIEHKDIENNNPIGPSLDVYNLSDIISIINENKVGVQAIDDNGYIKLISTDETLLLESGLSMDEIPNLEKLGLPEGILSSQTLLKRTLQDVLDDRCSIKNFGVRGDGYSNDGELITNSILSLYGELNDPSKSKELFFPSGEYLVDDSSLLLITNTHLKGEGIGRTIIKSINGNGPLVTTGDSNYIPATSDQYLVNATAPYNILVEDMTFDISESTKVEILRLGSCNRVYFRNVEFIGREASILINAIESSSIYELFFENCRFKGPANGTSQNAIVINGELQELNITTSDFSRFLNEAIILTSNEEIKQYNSLILGNHFHKCGENSGAVLRFGENTSYITVAHNIFDKEVNEQTSNIRAYLDYGQLNRIDVLNPNEDTRKFLRFKYNQPEWSYVDELINPNGEELIKTEYPIDAFGNIPTLKNGLILKQGDYTNNNTVSLTTSLNDGDLEIGVGRYGNLNLGIEQNTYNMWEEGIEYKIGDRVEYVSDNQILVFEVLGDHISSLNSNPLQTPSLWKQIENKDTNINIGKNIDLQGNTIHNKTTNEDISFETDTNVVRVVDNNSSTSYEYRIANDKNALANVAYVNTFANPTIRKRIDFKSIEEFNDSKIPLIDFDSILYGDFVYLKKVSVNVRRPFYPMMNNISEENAIEWKSGYTWYAGDIVKHTDNQGYFGYYACTKEHLSSDQWENDLEDLQCWVEVYAFGTDYITKEEKPLSDIKYLSIVADNGVDATRFLFLKDEINVSRRDVNGKYYQSIEYGKQYIKGEIAEFNNHYYRCIEDNIPTDVYYLHDINYWKMIEEAGYNYIFDFEKPLYQVNPFTQMIEELTIDEETNDFILEYNFSGYKLDIELYDENGILLPVIENTYYQPNAKLWGPSTLYVTGECIEYENNLYEVVQDFTSGNEFETIISGDVVLKDYVNENTKCIQINPSGAMIVTLEYMRG